jgi:hypothetical protein
VVAIIVDQSKKFAHQKQWEPRAGSILRWVTPGRRRPGSSRSR